ncbi:nucleotide exchange factor GrpE [Candidatus Woesearchaeota archaeon]|nr:nucleotide exchange factor GrpE [Candidatus Woesearchaeota archaeon]
MAKETQKKALKGESVDELEKVNKELMQDLSNKNKELTDTINHLQRLQAEFQNYQKNIELRTQMFKEYASFELISKLVNVLDEFDAAIKNLKTENKEVFEGIKMIFNNFRGVLEKEGLKEINAMGKKFDPFNHEPIQKVNVDGKKDGEIVEEIQKGYFFKEKVLRPSRVIVASGELFFKKENLGKETKGGNKNE